jgi:hypothetical protein
MQTSVRVSSTELALNGVCRSLGISGDGPDNIRPVAGATAKVPDAGGSTGIEAGCARTRFSFGGAVPSLPGRIGWITGGRWGVGKGATGAHPIPAGSGISGVTR